MKKLKINEVSFLEIGWERTTLISYKNDKLKLIKSIPIGGFHITKDISNIFKISLEESEKIKGHLINPTQNFHIMKIN